MCVCCKGNGSAGVGSGRGVVAVSAYMGGNLMRISRWSELRVDTVCLHHEVMREAGAIETSGELGSALDRTLMVVSQLRRPWSDPLIESAILLPLVLVDPEYQDG